MLLFRNADGGDYYRRHNINTTFTVYNYLAAPTTNFHNDVKHGGSSPVVFFLGLRQGAPDDG